MGILRVMEIRFLLTVCAVFVIVSIIIALDFYYSKNSIKYFSFKNKWLSSDKIKYTSEIFCYSLIIFFYFVFQTNKITLICFESENFFSVLSAVLTIWGIYGVYIGFLQFMTEYDNNENGKYLGYNKLDFIAESNIWYHITTTSGFIVLLLLSVALPIYFLVHKDFYKFLLDIWQSAIIFLLLLFIFLLKFSLDVVVKTMEIKKKKDSGLKYFIKKRIKDRYKEYLYLLIKNDFKETYINAFFSEIRLFLDNTDVRDQIEFLSIVFGQISTNLLYNSGNVNELMNAMNKEGRKGYKDFLTKKYDLLDEIGKESPGIADLAFNQLIDDYKFLDYFVKKDIFTWDQYVTGYDTFSCSESNFQDIPIKRKVYYRNFYNIENIHIELFNKFVKISKDRDKDYLILKLIKKLTSKEYKQKKWVSNSENLNKEILDIYSFTSMVSISNSILKDIKDIVIISKDQSIINFSNKKNRIEISLTSSILQIEFNYHKGNKKYISQSELQYYFDNFLEVVWKQYFDLYVQGTGNFKREPNILRDPEILEIAFNGEKRRIVRDIDNKILYSNTCFNYLVSNYGSINTETENFYNLIKIVKSMTKDYQGAFSLYQLLYPNYKDWDASIEVYCDILEYSLPEKEEDIQDFYNDLVVKITSIKNGSGINKELLHKIFRLREEENIDDEFYSEFTSVDLLRVLLIQSRLSNKRFIYREITIENPQVKFDILKKYLLGISVTPSIFLISLWYETFDNCVRNFYKKNIEFLDPYAYSNLPLPSLMKIEKLLDSQNFRDLEINEQEFMIDKIRTEIDNGTQIYSIYSPFLEFFTLKLPEGQGNIYQKLVNDINFRKVYKESLLYHMKKSKFATIDDYLSYIQKELTPQKGADEFEIGDFEKVILKNEIEKIIFQNYNK